MSKVKVVEMILRVRRKSDWRVEKEMGEVATHVDATLKFQVCNVGSLTEAVLNPLHAILVPY